MVDPAGSLPTPRGRQRHLVGLNRNPCLHRRANGPRIDLTDLATTVAQTHLPFARPVNRRHVDVEASRHGPRDAVSRLRGGVSRPVDDRDTFLVGSQYLGRGSGDDMEAGCPAKRTRMRPGCLFRLPVISTGMSRPNTASMPVHRGGCCHAALWRQIGRVGALIPVRRETSSVRIRSRNADPRSRSAERR
jgi:hypothetical protein